MKISNITIRKNLLESDKKKLKDITISTGFFEDEEIDIAVELIEENLTKGDEKSEYYFLIAEKNEEVVGYSCYGEIPLTKSRYDLYWIVVDDKYRGQSIGTKLLEKTEDMIKLRKGKKIYAETSSKLKYYPTRQFYMKNAYYIESTIKDFYSDGDDKVIFVKDL